MEDCICATTAAIRSIAGTRRSPASWSLFTDPADYNFETGLLLTRNTGHREDTLVIAPFFQTIDDGPAQDEAYWTSSGWKKGHLSVEDGLRPQRVSSYAVMDIFLREVALEGRFPNLEAVVVAGHSAGGQYAHRYAAGGQAEPELPAPVRYVVANPSSYLYLGLERKTEAALDEFEVPSTAECSGYNIWHYGLEGLNTYMNGLSEAQIIANLTTRDVFIMVGTEDTGSDQLDVSCGAILQGANRYIRGLVLINYMDAFWPGHHHSRHVVQGIAHSSRGMFGSEKGVAALFGELQPAAVASAMLAPSSPLVGY